MHTTRTEQPSLTGFCLYLAAGALDECRSCSEQEPDPEPWERIEAELQLGLFDPREDGYTFPEDELRALDRPVERRRGTPTDYSSYSDDALIDALWGVNRHKGRGLSASDWECQREFQARLCGVGWVRSLTRIDLPDLYSATLGTGRSRRLIVRLLMLADSQGWLGIYGPASRLCRALRIDAATWWRAVAWLEHRGWLRRVRTYKSRKHSSKASVDFSRNCYVPGPTLLLWRNVYRSELSDDRSAFVAACWAERRYREGRAAYDEVATVGEDLLAYASTCKMEIYRADVHDRAAAIVAGEASWTPVDASECELPQAWWSVLDGMAVELAHRAGSVYERCVVAANPTADHLGGASLFTLSHDAPNSPRGGENHEIGTDARTAPPAASAVDTLVGGCLAAMTHRSAPYARGAVSPNMQARRRCDSPDEGDEVARQAAFGFCPDSWDAQPPDDSGPPWEPW